MPVYINLSETKYGILEGISSVELYDNGKIKECSVNKKNVLNTPAGPLTPQYRDDGARNKYINALSFYKNGNIKKIALQKQSIVESGIGLMKAELITFYESGKIKRVFPLNGKITGYWTEDNEYELAEPQEFILPFGNFKKKIINVLFYENGNIKSITLWPKELAKLNTPADKLYIHYGLCLYPDGSLKSCEPAFPVLIDTVIGKITAFDVNASGINGDINSLNFNENGGIKSVITSTDSIEVTGKNGETRRFEPVLRPGMPDEAGMDIIPLKVEFYENRIKINENNEYVFGIRDYSFTIINKPLKIFSKCSNCSGCNGC